MKTNNNTQPPDMSTTLREFNHLFKESNDIYHTAALKLKLSDSALEILYSIVELGDGCLQRDICEITYLPKANCPFFHPKADKGRLSALSSRQRTQHAHSGNCHRTDSVKKYYLPFDTKRGSCFFLHDKKRAGAIADTGSQTFRFPAQRNRKMVNTVY